MPHATTHGLCGPQNGLFGQKKSLRYSEETESDVFMCIKGILKPGEAKLWLGLEGPCCPRWGQVQHLASMGFQICGC